MYISWMIKRQNHPYSHHPFAVTTFLSSSSSSLFMYCVTYELKKESISNCTIQNSFWLEYFWVVSMRDDKNRKNMNIFWVQNQVILARFLILLALVIFVLETIMKFWSEVLLVLLYVKQPQIDPKKTMFRSFGSKTKSFFIDLQVWRVLIPKVINFDRKIFDPDENDKNWTEKNVGMFWEQN